jgi:VacB/RNase II family 3'-5' exoribonuclease
MTRDDHNAPTGLLQRIAHKAMIDRGLEPDFPKDALAELATLTAQPKEDVRDLRALLWCSIDNDDSRDLDQLSVSAKDPAGTKILVAIADVDALVKKGSALDRHAHVNTTSVYTAAQIFPMLPERLSTDMSSLNGDEDRYAIVIEYVVKADGTLGNEDVYRALVRNHAKLAYNSVAAWLDGTAPMPAPIGKVPGMEEQLREQDRVAQAMKAVRQSHGALSLDTGETHVIVHEGKPTDLEAEAPNRAKTLIEDFMVAGNGVVARFLDKHKLASLRRVLKSPERWARIVALAGHYGEKLPGEPSSEALEKFLLKRKAADPERFQDLSLSIVKLLGRGEYVYEAPGSAAPGHFGLAVRDYTHSTAPNRRYPDLVTQRLVKAALTGVKSPYSTQELTDLAAQCTKQEDAATKVERQVRKSAAAMVLAHRIGETFDGMVTGASDKGTYVRIFKPPVEGRVMGDTHGLDVGEKLRVKLTGTNVERGFIDFERA